MSVEAPMEGTRISRSQSQAAGILSATVTPQRYVLLGLASVVTGYTAKAMQRKIERGVWPEGKVWRRAPDGRILIDLVGYTKWVESA